VEHFEIVCRQPVPLRHFDGRRHGRVGVAVRHTAILPAGARDAE
jgi:hypothetical protein